MVQGTCNNGRVELSITGTADVILAELTVMTETALKQIAKDIECPYSEVLTSFISALFID